LGRILVEAGTAADGTFDVVGGNVVLFGRDDGVGKVGIFRRFDPPLGGKRDEFGMNAENFPAGFRGDFLLALYYRSASHNDSTVKNT